MCIKGTFIQQHIINNLRIDSESHWKCYITWAFLLFVLKIFSLQFALQPVDKAELSS